MITDKGIGRGIGQSPWCPFPDDKMLGAFKGLLEKWPTCPLCGGRYGFLDYSGYPITLRKDIRINCLNNTHFHAEIEHNARRDNRGEVFIKKRAMFSLRPEGYNVQWTSNYPNKIHVSFSVGRFETKVLRLNFGSIDKWLIPEAQLKENLDKYRILI